MRWKFESLPYGAPATVWLGKLRALPNPFLLNGGAATGQRYDILGADPRALVTVKNGLTWLTTNSEPCELVPEDPFALLQRLVAERKPVDIPYELPFVGGVVGFFGYELIDQLERLPTPAGAVLPLPDMAVGIYEWFVTIDHLDQSVSLVGTPNVTELEFERVRSLLHASPAEFGSFEVTSEVTSNFDREGYDLAIGRIKAYIEAGDCYQVNLAQRFSAGFRGDALALYDHVASLQQAPYGAYLQMPEGSVLSFSPERFLRVTDGTVTTQPIKGTRPRGDSARADRALADALMSSEKDRAENLMIVDLLRNDLGRCCVPGSITVQKLFELQSFENVHHLVSTITGQLADGITPLDLLRASFPGGSITGAPKIRAMEIIRELEPDRRGPYCGAIGYYSYNGNLDTNLSIRTMACTDNRAYYWGGGGIVADSTASDEYAESLAKVDFIRRALRQPPHQSTLAAQNTR